MTTTTAVNGTRLVKSVLVAVLAFLAGLASTTTAGLVPAPAPAGTSGGDALALEVHGDVAVDGTFSIAGGTPIGGHVSATVAWDPPLIPAGQTASSQLTIAGADQGDPLAVGFSIALAPGVLLTATMAAPNVAYVTMANLGGVPIDPITGTLRVDAWKH